MGGKYHKTVKEETMEKLNMTSKEYDKLQQKYFSQDPEAYSDVADSIAKEDERRMNLNKKMELKELDKKIKDSGNQKIKKNNKGGLLKAKKVKPLMGEILNATDKRRRKEFLARSKKPISLKKKKLKTIKAASGGLLEAAPNKGVTKLPKNVRNKMGFMKKGGAVKKIKKCRMDGIAIRGKTRAKQRSK